MLLYIAVGVVVLYLWLKWYLSYWSRVGLETYQRGFLENIFTKMYNGYFYFKEKGVRHGGTFLFFKTIYIPVDLEIVKSIVQGDFNHFVNRGLFKDPPPIIRHIGNMNDEEWRIWRARLTPTFTSGKMKMMFHTMIEKGSTLTKVFKEQATINEPIDIKDIMSRYTTDVIASTSFGIECNSFNNPNAEFQKFGKKLMSRAKLFPIFALIPPFLIKLSGLRLIPEELESFFLNIIKETIEFRESNNVFRKDFMHLLLQLKNKGKVGNDNDENVLGDKNKSEEHLSLIELAAHALSFFGAGFELSATTITFAMLELAQDQEVQDKLRKNIRDVLKEHHGEITYEAVVKMEYLNKVVEETLRKYPPAQMIPRLCNKDYHVPGTNFVIRKGQQIMLPFRAIQHDPEYWPDPERFDPERFNAENKAKRHRYAYMPFGEGPRMCIGARFALLQTKIGIISVIKDFKLTLSDKNPRPIKIDYGGGVLAVKGILWMNIQKVD